MRLRSLVYICILALPLGGQTRVHVEGSVRADQPFRKEIGSGLFLSLVPITSTDSTGFGWQIEVKPGDESDDLMRCVTEPIHGPTPADLLAWQFVTEANEELPDSELSPLKTRRFQFVLNAADQKKVCDELNVVAYGPHQAAKDVTEIIGTPGYKRPALANGRFVIKTIQLSNLGKGNHARFESLTFEAEFELPRSRDNRSMPR
jgi:hypothetical protein